MGDPRVLLTQIRDSQRVLDDSQKREFPYSVTVCDRRFIVRKGVFSPECFGSTRIFSRLFPSVEGRRFLEIGCGTGATAVLAALGGASEVWAVDVNPLAVANTLENAQLHGVHDRVVTRVSDVYDNLGAEQFDVIYWNLPFIFVKSSYTYPSDLERSLYDPDYRYTRRFLAETPQHLNAGGRAIVGFGDFGCQNLLLALAHEHGFLVKEIGRERSSEGGLVHFILYELTRT